MVFDGAWLLLLFRAPCAGLPADASRHLPSGPFGAIPMFCLPASNRPDIIGGERSYAEEFTIIWPTGADAYGPETTIPMFNKTLTPLRDVAIITDRPDVVRSQSGYALEFIVIGSRAEAGDNGPRSTRSEEHTSELQSHSF